MTETMKYRLSGRKDFYVPAVEKLYSPIDENTSSKATPEWMVKIDGVTESEIIGYINCSELLGWFGESARKINGNNTQYPAASLRHSEVVVIIPTGGHLAKLENKMNNGEVLPEVEIINFADGKTLQSIKYGHCTINSIQQELDRFVVKMNVVSKENTIKVYKAGAFAGNMESYVDYETGKTVK
jgi:hypothetical protein